MLRYGVNKWQNIGIQQPVDGNLISKTVDDSTVAAIVLKWQQYLSESGISSSETTQNHVTSFISDCSSDLDKILVRVISNPQMGKSLVRTIISNHNKKHAPDGSPATYTIEIDEDFEDIRTAEDQYMNSLLSDSTTDLAMAQRQRVGSFSSASTNMTSKYDHLASMLRTDAVKHSFYGSPERDESPLISPTVSELPSPETSVSRKYLSSIDEIDGDYLQETDRSTVEVLEWSNGLHGFRKAAPATEIDHSAHDFRFLHPMNKPLFPPGYVHNQAQHVMQRERSPVRSPIASGLLGQKLFASPSRHSPTRLVLPTIAESDAASGRSDSAPKFAPDEPIGSVPVGDAKDTMNKELSTETNEALMMNHAPQQHKIIFPEMVYESNSSAVFQASLQQEAPANINNNHNASENELDDISVGSSLSAASTASTTASNNSNTYKMLYLSATNELLRRKLQRKQRQAKKKKAQPSIKPQGGRETTTKGTTAVFCSPVKEGNEEKEEEREERGERDEKEEGGEVEELIEAEYVESDVTSMVTAVTAAASVNGKGAALHTPQTPNSAAPTSPQPQSPHLSVAPASVRSPAQDSPVQSPVKLQSALRHKAQNELTFKVAKFMLPFLLAIVLYVGGRYCYKTQVVNIWQNQQRLTDNPPLVHPRATRPSPQHSAPVATVTASNVKAKDNPKVPPSPSLQAASVSSSPSFQADFLSSGAESAEDLSQGSLSLHVSIRGLDGRAYSPGAKGQQPFKRGGQSTVANVYTGQFGAFRHAWVRIKGVFAAAVRTVAAPVQGLFSLFGRR